MRLVMMGTGTFAEPTFQALLSSPHAVVGLITQPDRAAGQERGSTRQTGLGMKNLALSHQIPVLQPESINTPEGVAALTAWQPELLVVAAYGQILSRDVLETAPRGGINIHASLLPKYRGAAPIAWAIAKGETQSGVTVIKMSIYLDAGDMLAQEAVAIGPEETAGELEARLAPLGARLAVQVISQIEAGTSRSIKQDKALSTKAPKLTKEHGLIDWRVPAQDIANHIRAMQPWPTAYTFLHHPEADPQRLLIYRTACRDSLDTAVLAPGQVVDPGDGSHGIYVAAGLNAQGTPTILEILELQPAGKRRMTAIEFLRGRRLTTEDRFGPEISAIG
jgi:methionyl-tRNA formyltransferase